MYLSPRNKSLYRQILKMMIHLFDCNLTYILIIAHLHGWHLFLGE